VKDVLPSPNTLGGINADPSPHVWQHAILLPDIIKNGYIPTGIFIV
jgi:hypothetical protein